MRFDETVVIGGGIAGLLAARVLADHAEAVTVVERDDFPEEPVPRKGVPQARHQHVLLTRGYDAAAGLLPGLPAALAEAGAVPMHWTQDLKLMSAYGWYPRYPSTIASLTCTRTLLEHAVRQQVAAHPRIRFRTGCEVTGLVHSGSNGAPAVTGVTGRIRRDHTPSAEVHLTAQLVVDASGRDSRLPQWLAALGTPAPAETTVDAHLGYASCLYEAPPVAEPDWQYLLVRNPLPGTRAGGICRVEHGRWLVTLAGFNADYPPHDPTGFLEFARSLVVPELADWVAAARPVTPITSFRRTRNQMRHLDRVPGWPTGLVAVGDAVCAFNPIYGQGMSVAALGAVLLGTTLETAAGPGFEPSFQRHLARLLRDPWTLATGEDYRYAETEGPPRSVRTRVRQWYGDQVARAAVHDPQVHRAFLEVVHMVRPPNHLTRPAMAARISRARLARR
jgi:2-polyprenyl-6-methoxyphenol hydroxylase-like FAD-dependent oxidoreductase